MDRDAEITASIKAIVVLLETALKEVHKVATENQPTPKGVDDLWNALDRAELVARRILQ